MYSQYSNIDLIAVPEPAGRRRETAAWPETLPPEQSPGPDYRDGAPCQPDLLPASDREPFVQIRNTGEKYTLHYFCCAGASPRTEECTRKELLCTVEQLLHKHTLAEEPVPLILDAPARTVRIGASVAKRLTRIETRILRKIGSVPGQQVETDELLDYVWGDPSDNRNTLRVHLFNLRRKLHNLGVTILYNRPHYVLRWIADDKGV